MASFVAGGFELVPRSRIYDLVGVISFRELPGFEKDSRRYSWGFLFCSINMQGLNGQDTL